MNGSAASVPPPTLSLEGNTRGNVLRTETDVLVNHRR